MFRIEGNIFRDVIFELKIFSEILHAVYMLNKFTEIVFYKTCYLYPFHDFRENNVQLWLYIWIQGSGILKPVW